MKAAVIGSGAWGTTLAKILSENGHDALIWSHDENISQEINAQHENRTLLPERSG
jgi:glycerol-3-phosphate dehydrogenase (NAD(P)+)